MNAKYYKIELIYRGSVKLRREISHFGIVANFYTTMMGRYGDASGQYTIVIYSCVVSHLEGDRELVRFRCRGDEIAQNIQLFN